MSSFYDVAKANAQKFANERKQTVYIARAKRKIHHRIFFNKEELTPNYEIIEEVKPQ